MNVTNYALLVIMVAGFACSDKDPLKNDEVKIEGFIIRDALGNQLAVVGDPGVDWTIGEWSSLSAREQGFLSFSDNIDMNNTISTSLNAPLTYPNPTGVGVNSYNMVLFHSADSVKVKLAIVNTSGVVLKTYAVKIKGITHLSIDLTDTNKFPAGIKLRYYYSYSASGHPNFKAGYGDVKLCNDPVNWTQCF
jgi:hypothetical protein